MIITTVLWGSTFSLTKLLILDFPVFYVNFIRHLIALIAFLPLFIRLRKTDWKIILMALITGGANFVALSLQTIALQSTTPGKSAFITALYIVITPLFTWIVFKVPIKKIAWIALILALVGMGILIFPNGFTDDFSLQLGDLLTLFCAMFFTVQIVFTERFSPQVDVVLFSILQLAWVMILSLIVSLIFEPFIPLNTISGNYWFIWIILGVLATTLPFLFQNYGQKYINSTSAVIIFSLEPVFATVFGIIIFQDVISWQFFLGAGLILSGTILSARIIDNKKPIKSLSQES